MKSTLIVVVLVGLCLVGSVVRAQDSNGIQTACTIGVYDKYLCQWSGNVPDRRTSIQADVGVTLPSGLGIDVWTARQIGAKKDGVDGNEIDLTLSWSGEILGLTVAPALAYYDFSPLAAGRTDNVWAPSVKVSKSYGKDLSIAPFIRVEGDIPEKGSSFSGGMYTSVGVDLNAAITKALLFAFSPYVTYDNGDYSADRNYICGQVASLQYVTGNWTVVLPSFVLTSPLESDSSRKLETCLGCSAKYAF